MKTQPTPGHWIAVDNGPHIDSIRIFAENRYIGSIGNSDETKDQTIANAEHIVRCVNAAPKAIAALEDCIKWLSVGQRPQCKAETLEDLIRITAAALAELKGE